MNSEDFFYDDGISDSELASIPEQVFSEQSGGKLKLQLEPFRKRGKSGFWNCSKHVPFEVANYKG